MGEPHHSRVRRRKHSPAVLAVVAVLLAAPFVALLSVGTYNSATPRLWGFPFFYWYQLLWVIIAAAATTVAYLLITRTGKDAEIDTDEDDR